LYKRTVNVVVVHYGGFFSLTIKKNEQKDSEKSNKKSNEKSNEKSSNEKSSSKKVNEKSNEESSFYRSEEFLDSLRIEIYTYTEVHGLF